MNLREWGNLRAAPMAESAVLTDQMPATTAGRAPGAKFAIPAGWVARGFVFEVGWPDGDQAAARIRSHFGARRMAYNWALGQVKADMDARTLDSGHASVQWNLYALRKRWNAEKTVVAPWWAENSKEAYATGIADLCTALQNWKDSKSGKRKGRRAGFPEFRSKRKDRGRVRFTTGAIRAEADRRTITVPVIGALRSKESTRRLERLTALGKARILNATVSERWGRLFVSFGCIVQNHDRAEPSIERAGVDLGLRVLATIADTDGTIRKIPNPAPLRAALAARRQAGRHWPDHASCSTVGAAAPIASLVYTGSDGQDAGSTGAVGGHVRPEPSAPAVPGEARTRKGTPRRGAA